jgi:hypothetical protein
MKEWGSGSPTSAASFISAKSSVRAAATAIVPVVRIVVQIAAAAVLDAVHPTVLCLGTAAQNVSANRNRDKPLPSIYLQA